MSVISSSSVYTTPVSSSGLLVDSRNGQVYKTVNIGTQTWMAENLNYETMESFCYNLDGTNCTIYGRLYTWIAAKTACPGGWHLPDTTEWRFLINTVGGENIAGQKLKAATTTILWAPMDGIRNQDVYGFAALPAGCYNDFSDIYHKEGYLASFWSSTEGISSVYAYSISLVYDGDGAILKGAAGRNHGLSVRCIKD
ncbi:fibrobacter succinogenes major paralogous domain-containing protein [Fibrobacter sp.]|uniref:fibrobacter succinogenes major paralogous domain-containing protein n=1 Tax=Fibrobacter sp. TaxID=35828 RepID=UPI003866B3C3